MIDEVVLWWSGHVERMENNRIAKRVYVGECAGSHTVDWKQERWIDTNEVLLKKKVWMSARKMVFVRGNA